jgi:hypothetical protein
MAAPIPPVAAPRRAGNPWFDDLEDPAEPTNGDDGHGGGTHAGLPRRVRQGSLAPQLREERGEAPAPPREQRVRTPEEARSLMSSMQDGWQRGRAPDDGDATDGD